MPKKLHGGQTVVDCMKAYIPREHQAALQKGVMIKEPGKSGEEKKKGKIAKSRLKHRPDGRKYVKPESLKNNGEEVTRPQDVNPGKSSIIRICVDLLWKRFKEEQLEGIVGRFNLEPVHKYRGLEKFVSGKCLLRDECSFGTGECSCIWRPFQLLTWGRSNSPFVALPEDEVIRCSPITMFDLRDQVREIMPKDRWLAFRDKPSKKYDKWLLSDMSEEDIIAMRETIAAHKLKDLIQTNQRTNFKTSNCYGVAFHQFAIAIDSWYEDDDLNTVSMCLAVNERDPSVENYRQAQKRLAKKEQTPKPKKEEKREIKDLVPTLGPKEPEVESDLDPIDYGDGIYEEDEDMSSVDDEIFVFPDDDEY